MATDPRNQPGVVTMGPFPHLLATVSAGKPWLRGSHGNLGRLPRHIANGLLDRPFNSFDLFRQAFWTAVGKDAILAPQFSPANVTLMKQGNAPRASSSQNFTVGLSERQNSRPDSKPLNNPVDGQLLAFVMRGSAGIPGQSYHLHHVRPIHAGGAVYELSNLVVVTPRLHQEILASDYHYNR